MIIDLLIDGSIYEMIIYPREPVTTIIENEVVIRSDTDDIINNNNPSADCHGVILRVLFYSSVASVLLLLFCCFCSVASVLLLLFCCFCSVTSILSLRNALLASRDASYLFM